MAGRLFTLRTALAAGLLLAAVITAPALSAASSSSAKLPLLGLNTAGIYAGESNARIDGEVAAARSLHATVMRVAMPWSTFEPQAPGTLSAGAIAAADRLVADAAKANVKLIADVYSTPCWASTAPAAALSQCRREQGGSAYAWMPRQVSLYGQFVSWLAKRYGAQLAAIEVWNEPDQANQHYLAGPDKPQHYAELLRAAYPAVKSANPAVKVLAGSLVGSNGAFMKALYAAGIKGYYDGVAVHFYNLVLASVRVFHEFQLANGDHTPLWLDEFGWPSCWPSKKIEQEQACVSSQVQAANVISAYRELSHSPYVAADAIYKLQNSPGEDFGMITAKGRHKPAFSALGRALRSPLAPPSQITLSLRAEHGQVVARGSAPVGDYMRLEAFASGRLRYRAIFTLDRFNRYSLGLPAVLGTHGLLVRVYQYWLGSSHDAQRSI